MTITIVTGVDNLEGHRVSIWEVDGQTVIMDTRSPEQIAEAARQFAVLQSRAEARGKIIGETSQLQQALRIAARDAARAARAAARKYRYG